MFGVTVTEKQKHIQIDEKIINAVLAARKAIDEAEIKIADITGQQKSAASDLELVEAKLELAERARADLMERFVKREVTEAERDAAVQAVQDLRLSHETVAGVLTACNKTLREINLDILNIERQGAEQRFYAEVFKVFQCEAKKSRPLFLKALSALMLTGRYGIGNRETVFRNEFFDLYPDVDERRQCVLEIEDQFLKK